MRDVILDAAPVLCVRTLHTVLGRIRRKIMHLFLSIFWKWGVGVSSPENAPSPSPRRTEYAVLVFVKI